MGRKKIYKNRAEKEKALRRRKKLGKKLRRVYVFSKNRLNEIRDIEEIDFETNDINGVKNFLINDYPDRDFKCLGYCCYGNDQKEEDTIKLIDECEEEIEIIYMKGRIVYRSKKK